MNNLTPDHITAHLTELISIANRHTDDHVATGRNLTITLKVQLKFDKDKMRSEWRAAGSVDIPDGELDSEVKRTASEFLMAINGDAAGQQRMDTP